jgi:HK97 family phage prohead protease
MVAVAKRPSAPVGQDHSRILSQRKTIAPGAIQWKTLEDGAPEGSFTATFATLNTPDLDNDLTVPGAFQEGQAVRITQFGHNWYDLPVGRGIIHADATRAWVDGQFFTDTDMGQQTYLTIKNLGELAEWSYGFDIKEWSIGEFEGQQVRFLRALDVFEVSPVLLGAGVDTGTDDIKAGSRAKVGRRNSASDLDLMTQAAEHIAQALAHLRSIMGTADDEGDDDENTDGGGENADDGGKSKRETIAARLAIETLAMDS